MPRLYRLERECSKVLAYSKNIRVSLPHLFPAGDTLASSLSSSAYQASILAISPPSLPTPRLGGFSPASFYAWKTAYKFASRTSLTLWVGRNWKKKRKKQEPSHQREGRGSLLFFQSAPPKTRCQNRQPICHMGTVRMPPLPL